MSMVRLAKAMSSVPVVIAQSDQLRDQGVDVFDAEQFGDDGQGGPVKTAHEVPGTHGELVWGWAWRERELAAFQPGRQFFAASSRLAACAT